MNESGEAKLVQDARARWVEANDRASALAAELFQPGSGYGDPNARQADEHTLQTSKDEAERLYREYNDLVRVHIEAQMLGLQRSQRLATWASFAVAAVVGLATVVNIVVSLMRSAP